MNFRLLAKAPLIKFLGFLNQFSLFRYSFDFIFDFSLTRTANVNHNGIKLRLISPNQLINYRIKTFSSKEPETLAWIDTLESSDVLWDIGANIGLYTCYAASKGIPVVAFEPSYLNIHTLVANISLNNLSSIVTIVPLPLSNKCQVAEFNSRFTRVGSALSSFSDNIGYDGKTFTPTVRYSIPGLTVDSSLKTFDLPAPSAIKIDVDGLEHLILDGSVDTLKLVRTVLIEVNDNFHDQSDSVQSTLTTLGFKLLLKEHSALIEQSDTFDKTFNQIWIK